MIKCTNYLWFTCTCTCNKYSQKFCHEFECISRACKVQWKMWEHHQSYNLVYYFGWIKENLGKKLQIMCTKDVRFCGWVSIDTLTRPSIGTQSRPHQRLGLRLLLRKSQNLLSFGSWSPVDIKVCRVCWTMPIFGMSRDHNRKRLKTRTEWIVFEI